MLAGAQMTFNLLTDSLFPVITRKGGRRWLSFAELADDDDDAPFDFDWPRADFNTAAYELAIGVATLALRPTRETDWLRLWRARADSNDLREKLAPLLHAFELDGEGPRFLQELGGLDGEATPIEALLIDTPGANGQKKNADLLTHRSRYPALGLPAAAMALYALQQFAPSGGAGNRTSMRGGGPMTTLIALGGPEGERPSLWRIILANLVASKENDFDDDDLPKNPAVARADARIRQGARGAHDQRARPRCSSAPVLFRDAASHRPPDWRSRCMSDDGRQGTAGRWIRSEAMGSKLRGVDASPYALPTSEGG